MLKIRKKNLSIIKSEDGAMFKVNDVIGKLRPVLEEYTIEKANAEQQITQKGTVPAGLCENCPNKNIVKVSKFGNNSQQLLSGLLSWMQTNDIRGLQSDGEVLAFKSTKKIVENIEGTIPLLSIGGTLEPSTEKVIYDYRISISRLKKKPFYRFLKAPFVGMYPCAHLDRENIKAAFPALVTVMDEYTTYQIRPRHVEQLWEEEEEKNKLELLCAECYERIEFLGCESGVRREGFIYRYSCPVRRILIEHLLEKNKIQYVTSEKESYRPIEATFYLPEFKVFLTDAYRDVEETIKALNPFCILTFGSKQDLIRYLGFSTNVIIFDENAKDQQFIIFDRDIRVEQSIEKIIQTIVQKLDEYSDKVRGKEHDRLIAAFQRIGQDLGFIVQSEIPMKGIRVDVIWLNREGKIDVAIEVETSAQWKKDVITTWESEPRLAVILAHYKTDKAVSDAIQYNLLEYMPHKLLLINYLIKKAYLIEKGCILKIYDLKSI